MMEKGLEEALFQIFDLEIEASESQKQRGGIDQGLRAGVTSGKHLDPLAKYIAGKLISCGIAKDSILVGSTGMEIPGWYRPNKQWDLLAFERSALVSAIELKSIGSSYGNHGGTVYRESD